MKDDVYTKIIDACELTITKTIGESKSYEELSFTMIAILTGIIGICSGARASEMGNNNEDKREKPYSSGYKNG